MPDGAPVQAAHVSPAALAYAKERLAQLQQMGISPDSLGVSGDPTQEYRTLSPILGALSMLRHNGLYKYMPGQVAPNVQEVVHAILSTQPTGPTAPLASPGHPAVEGLSKASNAQVLSALARARAVTQTIQHLRQLRPE